VGVSNNVPSGKSRVALSVIFPCVDSFLVGWDPVSVRGQCLSRRRDALAAPRAGRGQGAVYKGRDVVAEQALTMSGQLNKTREASFFRGVPIMCFISLSILDPRCAPR